jgi:uncharacterized surface protein with fasciclin (FAS1) repeats
MSRYTFKKTIAATLGLAVVSAGLFVGISSQAQNTPTANPSPAASPATTPPAGGTMTKPAGGTMTKPAGGSMTKPDGMSKPATAAPAGKTIVDLASKSKSFTTLVAALKAADLVDTLAGEGPFTVFAPTNAAFAKLPKGTVANLLKPENKEQLKKILTYHVVPGAITSKMLKSGEVDSVEGSKITVKVRGRNVMVNKAKVIMADVKASNGVIHAIDTVIMPAK